MHILKTDPLKFQDLQPRQKLIAVLAILVDQLVALLSSLVQDPQVPFAQQLAPLVVLVDQTQFLVDQTIDPLVVALLAGFGKHFELAVEPADNLEILIVPWFEIIDPSCFCPTLVGLSLLCHRQTHQNQPLLL